MCIITENKIQKLNQIQIVNNHILIQGNEEIKSITFFDMNGRQVLKEEINAMEADIVTQELNHGAYILTIEGLKNIETSKILLQNK